MGQISIFGDSGNSDIKHDKNFHTITGCLGASNHTDGDREDNDFYATEPIAVEWLMKMENLDHKVWECACGQGHLSKPLINAGYEVKSTDLIDRGFGQGGVDFLACNEPWDGDIITNPPYKLAEAFIEHGLELVPDGKKVCMFLKVQFLEGKNRKLMFEKYPPRRVWVSSSRIKCGKNGQFGISMVAYAWYVWEKGYQGDTILKWFN